MMSAAGGAAHVRMHAPAGPGRPKKSAAAPVSHYGTVAGAVGGMSMGTFAHAPSQSQSKAKSTTKKAHAGKENVPPKNAAASVNVFGKRAGPSLEAPPKRQKRQYSRRKKVDDQGFAVPGTVASRPQKAQASYAMAPGPAVIDETRAWHHPYPLMINPQTMEPIDPSAEGFAWIMDFVDSDASPSMMPGHHTITPPSILRKSKRANDLSISPLMALASPFSPSFFLAPTPNMPRAFGQPSHAFAGQRRSGHVMATPGVTMGMHSTATPTPLRHAMSQFTAADEYGFMGSPMLVPDMEPFGGITPTPLARHAQRQPIVLGNGLVSLDVRTPPTGRTPRAPFQFKCTGRSTPPPRGQSLQLTSLLGAVAVVESGGRPAGAKHAVFDLLDTPMSDDGAPCIPTLSQQCATINARTARIRRGVALGGSDDEGRRLSFASSVPDIGKSPEAPAPDARDTASPSLAKAPMAPMPEGPSASAEELEKGGVWQTVLGQTPDQKLMTARAREVLLAGLGPNAGGGLCDRLLVQPRPSDKAAAE